MPPKRDFMEALKSFRSGMVAAVAAVLIALPGTGCGKGRKVPGLDAFHAGVMQSRLYVSFVATALQWDTGVSVKIPGLSDAVVSVAPDLNSSGTVFQFSIPLASLLNQGRPFPLLGLPDGRAIPDIVGGMLPRWDFRIDRLQCNAYLSDDVFGLFVPIDFRSSTGVELPSMVSVEIQDERGNRIGRAYAIPSAGQGTSSGLLVLLPYLGGLPG